MSAPSSQHSKQDPRQRRRATCAFPWACSLVLLVSGLTSTVAARTIFVDNLRGHDQCDGSTVDPIDTLVGPVRTFDRALALARQTDTIHLVNTGRPYRGDLRLFGHRHSGFPTRPFRIRGNGSVISGAKPVPTAVWRSRGNLWWMAPRRKGHYLLLKDGKPLPRHSLDTNTPASNLLSIPKGHWASWRGRIYYRTDALLDHGDQNLAIAGDDCGITLYAIRHVVIENLTVRHWRLDGISAPGLCSDVVLRNVICRENGRAGMTISGTSRIRGEDLELTDNGKHSLLVEGFGVADLKNARLTPPPTLAP
ncbi:MAG: right-handed parallel beta-helix repeat-containing protein [Planctomycetaceae bacterium]|nr:right-handed parallel beta-helix repeat-containing protein [Planctomycetaceae bacterium]